jgi:hypothetical protein
MMRALVSTLAVLFAAQPGVKPEPPPQGPIPAGHPEILLPKVAADWPKAKVEDVASVEAILGAFYAVPAGAPGEARDWDRFRSLFVPDARMIPARPGAAGASAALYLTVQNYVEANKTYFEKGGFADREVSRRTESFGNIVHVWSTYESRRKPSDAAAYARGINSIQLLKDGERYWIVNVFWDHERPDSAIPTKYLTTPKD